MVFWVSHSLDYCIKIKYNNFPSSHVVVEVSCISPQPCSQGPLLMSPGVRETKEKLERTLGTRLIQSSGHIIYMYGHFPFNKNSSLKFQKFHGPNGTYIPVAQTDPNHCAIVIALVSRIQKSGTGYNLQGDPKNSGRTEPKWSVPFDF